jgi:hypothetical protein
MKTSPVQAEISNFAPPNYSATIPDKSGLHGQDSRVLDTEQRERRVQRRETALRIPTKMHRNAIDMAAKDR